MTDDRRLLIVGTGGLACALGASLARAGSRVTLIGTWADAVRAIGRRGILVHEEGQTWTAHAEAALAGAHLEPFALAVVLVKSPWTVRTAGVVAGLLRPDGLAVTLQNGLGNRETLATRLGEDRVTAGAAFLGATVLGPGEVSLVSGRMVIDARGVRPERLETLAACLRAASLPTELSQDFAPVFWAKLAANCAINPLTALHGVANGALLDLPELRGTLETVAREVGSVAAVEGVRLERDPAGTALEVAEATAGNRSSMLQDLARGAQTEIDALNGAVTAEGRRLAVATPVNERLFRLVRAREGRPVAEEAEACRP